VIAALDYRSLCAKSPGERPSLLFVAHREEILKQSIRTYREVLSDPNFGELYVGGARPERWRHVFASVPALNAYGSTNIARCGDDVYVSQQETGEGVPPLSNTRWRLLKRTADNWKMVAEQDQFIQREPCPMGVMGGTVFMSINPSTQPPKPPTPKSKHVVS